MDFKNEEGYVLELTNKPYTKGGVRMTLTTNRANAKRQIGITINFSLLNTSGKNVPLEKLAAILKDQLTKALSMTYTLPDMYGTDGKTKIETTVSATINITTIKNIDERQPNQILVDIVPALKDGKAENGRKILYQGMTKGTDGSFILLGSYWVISEVVIQKNKWIFPHEVGHVLGLFGHIPSVEKLNELYKNDINKKEIVEELSKNIMRDPIQGVPGDQQQQFLPFQIEKSVFSYNLNRLNICEYQGGKYPAEKEKFILPDIAIEKSLIPQKTKNVNSFSLRRK
jgi:hypothetical protein